MKINFYGQKIGVYLKLILSGHCQPTPLKALFRGRECIKIVILVGVFIYSLGNYINPDSYDMGKFSTIISPYSSGSAENLLKFLPEGQIFLDNISQKDYYLLILVKEFTNGQIFYSKKRYSQILR